MSALPTLVSHLSCLSRHNAKVSPAAAAADAVAQSGVQRLYHNSTASVAKAVTTSRSALPQQSTYDSDDCHCLCAWASMSPMLPYGPGTMAQQHPMHPECLESCVQGAAAAVLAWSISYSMSDGLKHGRMLWSLPRKDLRQVSRIGAVGQVCVSLANFGSIKLGYDGSSRHPCCPSTLEKRASLITANSAELQSIAVA